MWCGMRSGIYYVQRDQGDHEEDGQRSVQPDARILVHVVVLLPPIHRLLGLTLIHRGWAGHVGVAALPRPHQHAPASVHVRPCRVLVFSPQRTQMDTLPRAAPPPTAREQTKV
eukprot:1508086-Rhodomonas_salina.3